MRLCLVICLALSACSDLTEPTSPGRDVADAEIAAIDAAPIECTDQGELTIGHCIDRATDAPCRDFEASGRDFVEIDAGTVVPQIIGLQGSPMFVLALRIADFQQPLDTRPPLVQLEVDLGALYLGGYTSRPALIEDPTASANSIAPQLYVVTLLGDDATAKTAEIVARVSTDAGLVWCSHQSFIVGKLVSESLRKYIQPGPGELDSAP